MASRQYGIEPGRDVPSLRPLYRAIIVLSLCLTIRAQSVENITCTPPLFLENPQGANACKILVQVLTTCTESQNIAPPDILPINQVPLSLYGPPSGDAVTLACECTDVVYNLFSACAACQRGNSTSNWYSHDQWFRPCQANQVIMVNPTEVVNWMNHTYLPTFDVATALDIAAGLPLPSTTLSPSSTEGSVAQDGPESGSSPSSSGSESGSGHSSSNTGAIVGGVVGGVAFLVIVGIILFICVRKRKSRRVPPSAEFMKYAQSQGINNATVPLTHMSTDDDHRMSQSQSQSQSHPAGRNSALNHNYANSSTRSPSALGVSRNNTDETDAPPAFTTGLFKDPIFEKGVALNLAGAAAASGASGAGGPMSASPTGPNPLTQTPVTYSPATPSILSYPENQRLIHGRQTSS